jgi:hypothetical protein
LAEKGHNVYIFCEPEYPHKNIHIIPCTTQIIGSSFYSTWEQFTYGINNTVSIYTEHNLTNPFGTKHITRWILYHTKKELEEQYDNNEYYFNFGNFYTYDIKESGKLTTLDYNLDKLYVENYVKREGYCHVLHKNTPEDYLDILGEFNTIDISNWWDIGGYDYLRKVFNQKEYFLTFDDKTFLTTAATLCGCKVIILKPDHIDNRIKNAFTEINNNKKITPLEYRLQNPLNLFGVAYGIEDLKWAEDTIHLVRNHIIEMEKLDKKTVDKFIDFWNEKCYG